MTDYAMHVLEVFQAIRWVLAFVAAVVGCAWLLEHCMDRMED